MLTLDQETLNYWKQLTHVLKYFRPEEDKDAALPKTFIQGFIEVTFMHSLSNPERLANRLELHRAGTRPSGSTTNPSDLCE